MQIKIALIEIAKRHGLAYDTMQFPECEIDPTKIKVIMINEVVPKNPDDWFYSEASDPENRRNAIGLFEEAGVPVRGRTRSKYKRYSGVGRLYHRGPENPERKLHSRPGSYQGAVAAAGSRACAVPQCQAHHAHGRRCGQDGQYDC